LNGADGGGDVCPDVVEVLDEAVDEAVLEVSLQAQDWRGVGVVEGVVEEDGVVDVDED